MLYYLRGMCIYTCKYKFGVDIMTLSEEILELKRKNNALILAHYYQRPEVQDIADVVGDSYYLSKYAFESTSQLIIFCGVKFMAESVKILSPQKKVILPVYDAGCPMADMVDETKLIELKEKYKDAAVVCYINSSTEVKALCDVCVTSSNAIKIISKIKAKNIIFLPDKNLGGYLQERFPEKNFILWNGFCVTHQKVRVDNIKKSKEAIKDAQVLVHPECEKKVRDMADFIGSTGEIIDYATSSKNKNFLIVTEEGVLRELKRKNPNKNFYFPQVMSCVNMKKTRLEDVRNSLINQEEITIDEEIRLKALSALTKMHEMAR